MPPVLDPLIGQQMLCFFSSLADLKSDCHRPITPLALRHVGIGSLLPVSGALALMLKMCACVCVCAVVHVQPSIDYELLFQKCLAGWFFFILCTLNPVFFSKSSRKKN